MSRRVRFWDLAATANPDSDWTCGIRMARQDARFLIEHMVRGRWTPHERDQIILQTAQADGRSVEIGIEEEPGAAGKSQIAYLVQWLAGFRVRGVRPTGDKLTRAGPFASQAEAGNVRLLAGTWNEALLDALECFPSEGVHDDPVDACSGAFLLLTEPRDRPGTLPVGLGVKGWAPAAGGRRR